MVSEQLKSYLLTKYKIILCDSFKGIVSIARFYHLDDLLNF